MFFDPHQPFNDLPLLPPLVELESKAVLKKAISANRALAELKGTGELIPDQTLLIQSIGLQEAKHSSTPRRKENRFSATSWPTWKPFSMPRMISIH